MIWQGSVNGYIERTPNVCLRKIILGIACGLQYLHCEPNNLEQEYSAYTETASFPKILHGDLKGVRNLPRSPCWDTLEITYVRRIMF
jgi:serine/threonine protein kinase